MPKPMKVECLNHTPLTFGKYKGKTPMEVAEDDPEYLIWMHDNVSGYPTCTKELRDHCEQDERDEEADHDEDRHYGINGW